MTLPTQSIPGQQRSIDTRNKLIAATFDCIHEYGYHGTSTTKVIERAKMSRGAMLHHFPTRIDLISAAYEAIHTDIERDVLDLIEQAEAAGKTWSDLLDDIFARYFNGKQWEVFVEIMVAARTNQALRERLVPVIENYYGEVDRVWQRNFVTTSAETDVATLLNLSFCVIRGMAFQGLVRDKPAYYAEMMAQWKEMIGPLVESRWQK